MTFLTFLVAYWWVFGLVTIGLAIGMILFMLSAMKKLVKADEANEGFPSRLSIPFILGVMASGAGICSLIGLIGVIIEYIKAG